MDRVITVIGSGVASASPDAAVVSGEVSGIAGSYQEAVGASAQALTSIRKAVGDAGFDMDDLRTTRMSVDTVYRDEGGNPVLSGYRYRHGITITVDSDGDVLGKLLCALTGREGSPEFRVSYTVREPSEAIAAARTAAVRDARHRAKELAAAAGVKLGDIVGIEYASQGGSVATRGRAMMSAMSVDAVPTDVEFHDSVTMRWEIL